MHDSWVCIVRDGELLFAMAEGRLSRVKHDARVPALPQELTRARVAPWPSKRKRLPVPFRIEKPPKLQERICRLRGAAVLDRVGVRARGKSARPARRVAGRSCSASRGFLVCFCRYATFCHHAELSHELLGAMLRDLCPIKFPGFTRSALRFCILATPHRALGGHTEMTLGSLQESGFKHC